MVVGSDVVEHLTRVLGIVADTDPLAAPHLDRRGIAGESFVPWFFPTIEDYSARLRKAGFVVSYISLFPRPTPLPGDVTSWLESFAEDFLSALPAAERPAYIEAVREALRPKLCDANGNWTADYVRLRFAAQKARA